MSKLAAQNMSYENIHMFSLIDTAEISSGREKCGIKWYLVLVKTMDNFYV